jgi:hypothetical protein
MKIAIRLIIAVLFGLFAYVLLSLVLGTVLENQGLSSGLSTVLAIGAFLIALFGKGAARGGSDINGPGGMGPSNFDRDT